MRIEVSTARSAFDGDFLRAKLDELADPAKRNNWELLNSTLTDLLGALPDGLSHFTGFRAALESTSAILFDYRNRLAALQHCTNLPERLAWLKLELAGALGDPVERLDRAQLDQHRKWFELLPGRVPRLWQEQKTTAGLLFRIGTFRKEVRELRNVVAGYERDFKRAPNEAMHKVPDMIRRLCFDSGFSEISLREVIRVTSQGSEVGALLKQFRDDLYEFGADRNDYRIQKTDPKKDLEKFLSRAKDQLDTIERDSRAAFSDVLGFKVSRAEHAQVSIFEETGDPSQGLVQSVRRMMNEWLIDLEVPEPQLGFGRVYPAQEVRDFLTIYGGRLFRAVMEKETVGFYLIFVDQDRFPPHVLEAVEALNRTGEYMHPLFGWAEMAGLTQAGRNQAKASGVDLYTLMHEAVRDTFASFNREKVYAEVRSGTYANPAMKSHLKRGWHELGIQVQSGRHPYEIIEMIVSPGGSWGV